MGNSHLKLHGEAKLAATKFDKDEIEVLEKTWRDMAERNNGKGVDKETFLQYFPLNGLLGERLFAQFNKSITDFINFDDFITGLAIVCRGNKDEKIHFLFQMYDVNANNMVNKQELEVLLNHIPKDILSDNIPQIAASLENFDDNREYIEGQYTNHDIAEKAFEECDLHHEGTLNYDEFKMWIERNPAIMEYLENVIPYTGSKDTSPHVDKKETLPHMKRIASLKNMGGDEINLSDNLGLVHLNANRASRRMTRTSFSEHVEYHTRDREYSLLSETSGGDDSEEDMVRQLLVSAMETTCSEQTRASIAHIIDKLLTTVSHPSTKISVQHLKCDEGYLWKHGHSFLHLLSKRYYLLATSCLYYYNHPKDIRCKGVIFLAGSIIESIKEPDMELKGYYGFEILHLDQCTGVHHRHDKRVLYAKSIEERDKWVTSLQHAAHVVPIEEEYAIGRELGRGRFSIVKECVHKVTGKHCAVKIIDKSTIEQEDKSLLRTEIAILKLVNHPSIIHMEGLYESKQYIYIVMEMLKGGELFERIVGRPRFSEEECFKVIRPLLESVAYLHDLGIVHRDLKPENILCGENLEDLKIADFGLSKMVLPKETMELACGTLSYVAPEVLTCQGYGKEADLWSVGVIMFLLVCGKLPFDGDDQSEIIKQTVQAELKVNPSVWSKLSTEIKSLITSLLQKNPRDRISAKNALRHPYFLGQRRLSIMSNVSKLEE